MNNYLTPSMVTATGVGTIAAGQDFISVANIGDVAGVLMDATLPAGATVTLPMIGKQWGEITYNAGGTTFLILTAK
jgi:hypothetical protein